MNELVPGIVIKSTAVIDGPAREKGCGRRVLKEEKRSRSNFSLPFLLVNNVQLNALASRQNDLTFQVCLPHIQDQNVMVALRSNLNFSHLLHRNNIYVAVL